jgi:hypothetical protein
MEGHITDEHFFDWTMKLTIEDLNEMTDVIDGYLEQDSTS